MSSEELMDSVLSPVVNTAGSAFDESAVLGNLDSVDPVLHTTPSSNKMTETVEVEATPHVTFHGGSPSLTVETAAEQVAKDVEDTPVASGERTPTHKSTSHSKKKRKGFSFSKKRSRKSKKKSESSGVEAVAENYWEIEAIESFRKNKKMKKEGGGPVYEFLVKWVGFEERTWEPEENLCDSALLDARRIMSEQAALELGLDNPEKESLADDDLEGQLKNDTFEEDALMEEKTIDSPDKAILDHQLDGIDNFEDTQWDWSDRGQIKFRDIERISVNDPNVRQKVTDSRQNGVPIVVTGHVGWAQFAKQWLMEAVDENAQEITDKTSMIEIVKPENGADNVLESEKPVSGESIKEVKGDDLLDLSKTHYVDVEKMIADIGKESVPVIRKNYNEQSPIQSQITVETFLRKCWPTHDEIDKKVPMRKLPWLYLHQWQFPLSDTAMTKLTGKGRNNPLPNHILGDDLLCYWLDKERCNQDSPFQYLFMGREGTNSKLHRDNGGLLISIAPIIGTKEVTLVHRADGAGCLYHLDGPNIDQPDLHRFPLMYNVRAWRSVLKPGEILLMPQGTYHQCRNLTACLSYHRFYLDTVNLKAFLESFLDQDAPEIQHDDVIWNASHELTDRVNDFVETVRKSMVADVPPHIEASIDAIRVLRNICRELAMRDEAKVRKRRKSATDEEFAWSSLVDDIDLTLHGFRFRLRKRRPPFFRRKLRHESHKVQAKEQGKDQSREDRDSDKVNGLQAPDVEDEEQPPRTTLENAFRKLPRLDKDETGLVISDSVRLSEGDRISLRWQGKRVIGTVEDVQDSVKAAYLSFEEFPLCHDEYQPVDRLRARVPGGETSAEISADALHEGMHVFHVEQGGEEYRAVVKSWKRATFYSVNLELDGGPDFVHTTWVTKDSVIEKIADADPSSPHKSTSMRKESTPKSKQLASHLPFSEKIPLQPTKLDISGDVDKVNVVEEIQVADDVAEATDMINSNTPEIAVANGGQGQNFEMQYPSMDLECDEI